MIFLTLLSPLTGVYILGSPAILCFVLMGADLAVTLGCGVTGGDPGFADYISLALTLTLVALWFGVTMYMVLWRNLETYFSTMPWLRHASASVSRKRGSRLACPFTGLKPTVRCPSCSCAVHDLALPPSDPWVEGLPVCNVPLRWDTAKEALQLKGVPASKVREELDRCLDYRGNTALAGVTRCCLGCGVWQRQCHLRGRLSLGIISVSVTLVILPWAFANFADSVGSIGTVLQIIGEALSVYYGTMALLIQLQTVLRVNHFFLEHRDSIPEFRPLFEVPSNSFLRGIVTAFLRTPWNS